MSSQDLKQIKLQIKGASATPAPPIGPALSGAGIKNIPAFCKAFNDKTQHLKGKTLPVVITVKPDKTYTFIIKTEPAAKLILQAAGLQKGSPESNRKKVGTITWQQIQQIAKTKMPDLNAFQPEKACSMIAGTARSIGITITGQPVQNQKND